jgi:hypothetical protein
LDVGDDDGGHCKISLGKVGWGGQKRGLAVLYLQCVSL